MEEVTFSQEEQLRCERKVKKLLDLDSENDQNIKLYRYAHEGYLIKGFSRLSSSFQSLDASQPWLCYWILHSLDLLGVLLKYPHIIEQVPDFLNRCQDSNAGGFGGGPGQLPHLAPTYAAVNALIICGTEKAYSIINREKMYKFLISCKDDKTKSFLMHQDGENDVRGCYCALSVASVLNILTPELVDGVAEHIGRCQTYEGGIGGYPGNESHGGYTFCALAALILSGKLNTIYLDKLTSWAVWRQMQFEGGFQGRTNKLVDSCYSFWQGALFPLIELIRKGIQDLKNYGSDNVQRRENSNDKDNSDNEYNVKEEQWLFDQYRLQRYILLCCQEKDGGFRDKPGKSRDFYHTCYALSGLSIAQHNEKSVTILGCSENLLECTHPVYNICVNKITKALIYFSQERLPHFPN